MSIETDLKKDGITIIRPLDTLSITLIAKFVSEKFISHFPFYRIKYDALFLKVSSLNMYIANIPEGLSEANYFYKNESIYFKDGLDIDEMKELAVHEFIHHFQQKKDKENYLHRLGLADFTGLKVKGIGINEAAVQLISSKLLNKNTENVKYYGIELSTISPNYYPLLCNLVNQMAYITGYNVLCESTLYANNQFKNCFSKLCGKQIYNKIENNFDKILNIEEKLILASHDKSNTIKIEKYKNQIKETFTKTQNLIFTSYFSNTIHNLYTVQDIENYRQKLYNYKNYLGTYDNYSYFNNYYISMMSELEKVHALIPGESSIMVYKRNTFEVILSKIGSLFGKNLETEYSYKL